jgi:hypothetical protein
MKMNRVFGHWKTTLAGVVLAVITAVSEVLKAGHFSLKTLILAAAIAALGALAHDGDTKESAN